MTKREYAYNKIRDAITYSEFKPGERLIERNLCETFAVGRGPLREALSQLHIEGYLDFTPNKGLIVAKMSIENVNEIYTVIAVLEGHGAKAAAKAIDKESLGNLNSIQESLKNASDFEDPRRWLDQNALFHENIAKLGGNHVLCSSIKSLRRRIYRYRSISITIADVIDDSLRTHDSILQALSKKDPTKAGRLMERHILDVAEKTIQVLKRIPML